MGLRISYNAPVVLTFCLAAVLVHAANLSQTALFVAQPTLSGVFSYVGLLLHPLGHGSWDHLFGNLAMILLLGPILEERYGSSTLLAMMAITALITGMLNAMLFSTGLLGASGIVFMFILLASTANIRRGEIPLTFIAVACLFLGREVLRALETNQISEAAHVIGGLAGSAFGFLHASARGGR